MCENWLGVVRILCEPERNTLQQRLGHLKKYLLKILSVLTQGLLQNASIEIPIGAETLGTVPIARGTRGPGPSHHCSQQRSYSFNHFVSDLLTDRQTLKKVRRYFTLHWVYNRAISPGVCLAIAKEHWEHRYILRSRIQSPCQTNQKVKPARLTLSMTIKNR